MGLEKSDSESESLRSNVLSLKRYATKRDASEAPIVEALRAVGALVYRLDEPCDLLVRFRGRWHTLEVKTPYGKAGRERLDKRQETQQNFLRLTGTPIVKSPLDALRAVGAAICQ